MQTRFGWLLIIVGLFAAMTQAQAQESRAALRDAAGTGVFLLRSDTRSEWVPALLLNTEMDVDISGPLVQVRIRQEFANPGLAFAEGQYVLPISEQAAVHGMLLEIGERKIRGQVRERQEARALYQQARDSGQRTGLVEQNRPNLFRTSVANIGAGESIAVTLEYTELLTPDAGRFNLRLPLTMTPRYTPQPQPSDSPVAAPGQQHAVEGPIVANLRREGPSHQARLDIYLDSGMQLDNVHSPSHQIEHDYDGRGYQVELTRNPVIMDSDFILEWALPADAGNQAALFSETLDDGHYALLMLSPADRPVSQERQPREVLLIVDTSGSMQGERMRQARQSLIHALGRLQPDDRFNVLEFNHQHSLLFRQPMPATSDHLAEARDWITALQAGGGTEMLPVLHDALTQPTEAGYLRQLVFITDGSVSNEQAILNLIQRRLHNARVFTVGIGAAPNSYLLRKAAEMGRGQFTPVNERDGVADSINRLFDKLEAPVLTDLRIELEEGIQADIWPERLPDLYAGQPLVVALKLNRLPESITLHGHQPEPWQQQLWLPESQQNPGTARLWAQRKIDSLMDRLTQGTAESEVREAVLDVALQHQLMSRYTSFIAIEETPVRSPDEPLLSQQVPNLNPADHHMYPQTSLGLLRLWVLALALFAAALALLLHRRPSHA
ncbi:marine proteobacterial sortase target protein [Halopseudomonas salegens]|uniref:Ca-activated chloride channel family protein n=1 Tax=Halopseudomonas salegens TaxID=1434072 RepID=A0A1H2H1F6_9GAMM|nr:marine proteobacterial sortase target protein [Halopseudomonas salegens]SDU25692.1 Ca-activated chloride channel family protein [Halopseudomonas salegens]